MILHLFMNECLAAVVMMSFGEVLALKEGANFESFFNKFAFL